ncbi:MAG: (Fe-S)-binding protein [Deltaproteobacteria bacterium]|nr:(Fe-S)-binding protein [Deltaproteobacteria bacterium]
MKPLTELKDELNKCVRCGTCRSICPTFRVIGRESASARGKLALIDAYLKGEIASSETYLKHIKECTLCGACRDGCPNGVDTIGIITAARAEAVQRQGMPYAASFILKTLLDPGRIMPVALKFASRIQGLLLKDSTVEVGLLSRFSLPLVGGGRLVPPLARQFFLDMPDIKALFEGARSKPAVSSATKPVRVAFYAGCGVNYLMPEVGVKSIEILRRAGAEPVVPSSQICCGMPAFSMGDLPTAKSMAIKNLEAFEACECDYITTSCATCGHALKNLFGDLLGFDPELDARVKAMAAKVRDITELLVNVLGYEGKSPPAPPVHAPWRGYPERGESPPPLSKGEESGGVKKTVTYHDPCHLNRAQGIRREPRRLIESAPGVVFKEMKFPCGCCGLGGGLSTTNYDLSISITKRKVDSIKASGADIVATACPGCMVQLRDGLHKHGVDVKVAHVVDLL